jgi:hypothetical protein
MTDQENIREAIKAVRRDKMGVRTAATKYGLSRERLRYHLQKYDAKRNALLSALKDDE